MKKCFIAKLENEVRKPVDLKAIIDDEKTGFKDAEVIATNLTETIVTARSAQFDQEVAIIQEALDSLLVKQQTLEDLNAYIPELEEEVSRVQLYRSQIASGVLK